VSPNWPERNVQFEANTVDQLRQAGVTRRIVQSIFASASRCEQHIGELRRRRRALDCADRSRQRRRIIGREARE